MRGRAGVAIWTCMVIGPPAKRPRRSPQRDRFFRGGIPSHRRSVTCRPPRRHGILATKYAGRNRTCVRVSVWARKVPSASDSPKADPRRCSVSRSAVSARSKGGGEPPSRTPATAPARCPVASQAGEGRTPHRAPGRRGVASSGPLNRPSREPARMIGRRISPRVRGAGDRAAAPVNSQHKKAALMAITALMRQAAAAAANARARRLVAFRVVLRQRLLTERLRERVRTSFVTSQGSPHARFRRALQRGPDADPHCRRGAT